MILGFSTKINNKPTCFVERIHQALRLPFFKDSVPFNSQHCNKDFDYVMFPLLRPKLHTIREDKNDRWKSGMKIDFFINVRQKDMFRFAPVMKVVSVQDVYMSYRSNDVIQISVDDKELFVFSERLEFAQNDGFDTWEDFFDYFYPQIKATPDNFLKMKLIHWTDKKY
ncbi:hypothetical protein QWY99_08555 [Flavobacterium branchiarum]|uniref:Uncharacterized protein n=1 Tax=Flavobacterium branchiarum TaxID=1114870 RepID=A0ABV5FPU6_9FLAO|nr:hypothetical protein [Flavobacterium branchiarum]MDN3673096.1 hypothetical protein [Flavobacterium branchiarum]